ncbi:hypothetical protein GWI34_25505 [Actinomadura sp. DSM 109109]|nr:hypothetical protein [Actinomadura lepetitiana]
MSYVHDIPPVVLEHLSREAARASPRRCPRPRSTKRPAIPDILRQVADHERLVAIHDEQFRKMIDREEGNDGR